MHLSGRVSRVDRTRIVSGGSWEQLEKLLSSNHFLNGRIFILTDRTTKVYCLPVLLSRLPCLEKAEILEIPAGEESKTLKQAELLWQQLFEAQADRSALLINLGGGMTSDLGGFIAAGFMRGIPYINLPTSLMGQVDASIGGKTAVNLLGVKNQLGFFYSPIAVFVFAEFLQSLSKEQLRSGFAEILKTALILDTSLYRIVLRQSIQQWMEIPVTDKRWVEIINRTICIKNKVVKSDFLEKKQRKSYRFFK